MRTLAASATWPVLSASTGIFSTAARLDPSARLPLAVSGIRFTDPGEPPASGGKVPVDVLMQLSGKVKLSQLILTLRPPSRLPSHLHRRHQQRQQHPNNRDHYGQFDQVEHTMTRQAIATHEFQPTCPQSRTSDSRFIESARAYRRDPIFDLAILVRTRVQTTCVGVRRNGRLVYETCKDGSVSQRGQDELVRPVRGSRHRLAGLHHESAVLRTERQRQLDSLRK